MAYSQTNYYNDIISRRIRSGRATSKTEVIHQALELLDAISRGAGPRGATFKDAEELERMVLAGFDSGPAIPMTKKDWADLRRRT